MRKIFLELIAVGKRHHFPKEVMIVSSVMMFKWKLNVYRKMWSLLIQEVLPADSGVRHPLPRSPSLLLLPVRFPILFEAGPDECLHLCA